MASRACRVCGRELPADAILHFDGMPGMAQHFPDATSVSEDRGEALDIRQCAYCGVMQASCDPVPYYRDVVRAAAFSGEMRKFRQEQFSLLTRRFGLRGRKMLEVGCGRGEYLRLLREAEMDAWGIEHDADSVRHCLDQGLPAIAGYIDNDSRLPHGPFDAFCSFNFMEHWPQPGATLAGIRQNLTPDGIGIVEVPNLDMILDSNLFAEFVRDHLLYFTAETLETTLRINGFEVLECAEVWHRYMLSVIVRPRAGCNVSRLREAEKRLQREMDSFLQSHKPGSVAVWGAGHQALALLALLDMKSRVRYVVDSAPFKQDRYTPATHIPIVAPDLLKRDRVAAVVVMAASYSGEVAAILRSEFPDVRSIAVVRDSGLEILA